MAHIWEYEAHIWEGKKTHQFYSEAQTEQKYADVVIYKSKCNMKILWQLGLDAADNTVSFITASSLTLA